MVLVRRGGAAQNLIAICIYAMAIAVAFLSHVDLAGTDLFWWPLSYAIPSLWVERCADVLEGKDAAQAWLRERLHEPYTGPSAGQDQGVRG